MAKRFTAAQLAAAPSAWMPEGATRWVSFAEMSPLALRATLTEVPPMAPARIVDVECPVVARHDDQDVVIAPDGKRLALRR